MPFEFINNQPIRFKSYKFDDQACINKDLSAYNVLLQPGDPLHWQARLRCCEDINLACDAMGEGAELVTDGDMSNPAAFGLGTGWSIAAGKATYTAPGLGNIRQVIAVTVGRPYKVTVDVDSNTTGFGLAVFLGSRRIGTIASGVTGTVDIYGTSGTGGDVDIFSDSDYAEAITGTAVIDNLSVKEVALCYTFDTSVRQFVSNGTFTGSAAGWSLEASWAYSVDNVLHTAGTVASILQTLSSLTHGDDYQVSLTVGGTAGAVTIIIGTILVNTFAGGSGAQAFDYTGKLLISKLLEIEATSPFDGTLDDISVLETQSGWSFDPESGFCHTPGRVNAFYAGNTITINRYYKIIIEVIVEAGSVLVEAGGVQLGTITKTGIYSFFFTALTAEGERFTPSTDFDGCILNTIDMCQLYRDVLQARLVYDDGITGATDWHTTTSPSNPLILSDDYVTWRITSLAAILSGGVPVALPYSCYRMQVQVQCDPADPIIVSTSTSDTFINYQATHSCTKMFMAYCNGDDLDFRFGFNGDMFRIYSRLRTLYFNPSYPIDAEDYKFSSGLKKRIYAELTKSYEVLFDYIDEYAHDVIWLMHGVTFLYIDGAFSIITSGSYEPEWAERGKRNLAQGIIEVEKSDGILFNRNCS